MRPGWVMLALLVTACGTPAPPQGFGGLGGGEEDTLGDDTAEECVTCELTDCEDDTEPEDVASEDDCSEAADEQGCAAYSFDEGC